jgi:transposase
VNNLVPQLDDNVVLVREFNTSAVCSACEHPVKMFKVKHRGFAIRKFKREKLEKTGEPVPVPDKAKLTETHQVVRCSNNACSKCWQRDINAARNIQKLLRLEQTGQPRPDVLSMQLPESN